MRWRWIVGLSVLGVALGPAPSRATDEPTAPPVAAPAPTNAESPASPEPVAASQEAVATAEVAQPASPAPQEEELVDFAAEERAAVSAEASGDHDHHGAGSVASELGLKLILDFVIEHNMGGEAWDFKPNHTNVLIEAAPKPWLSVLLDIDPLPLFYEIQWTPTPALSLKVGKILIPFGSNAFHHLIGGRVDAYSEFLPELWADYGVALSHRVYDGERFSFDYDLYVVNGFTGETAPDTVSPDQAENNAWKGLGTRTRLGVGRHYELLGSLYYDRWDAAAERALVFYSLAVQANEGFLPLAALRRLRLRAEWGRGEIELQHANYRHGLIDYAVARAGFYVEAQDGLTDDVALRLRVGQLNPNDAVSDDRDIFMVEPAVVLGSPAFSLVFAYQLAMHPEGGYDPAAPGDVLYTKVFLQF